MSFNNRSRNFFIITLFIFLLIPSLLLSQNISLTIGDATGQLGEDFVPLDVRISNVSDTIAGFNIWLQLDRPDLVKFQQGNVQLNDTTYWQCNQYSGADCIDSTQVFPTNSWDFFHVDSSIQLQYLYDTENYIMPTWKTYTNSIAGFGHDLLFLSLNLSGNQVYITPPQNDELLVRLYLEVVDELIFPISDSVVNVLLQTDFIDHFSFSTPSGKSIGMIYEHYLDTTCFECTYWVEDVCMIWNIVPRVIGEPIDLSLCDSIFIAPDSSFVLHPAYWQFSDGTFTLTEACGYSSGDYDISDLVTLVAYMFSSGSLKTLAEADCNCDCQIDISDLICFVTYMFNGGDAPGCPTQ